MLFRIAGEEIASYMKYSKGLTISVTRNRRDGKLFLLFCCSTRRQTLTMCYHNYTGLIPGGIEDPQNKILVHWNVVVSSLI